MLCFCFVFVVDDLVCLVAVDCAVCDDDEVMLNVLRCQLTY